MNRFASALVMGAIAPAALVTVVEAACNAIPSVDKQRVDLPAPMASTGASPDTTLSEFGYKGALGRIDRVYLLPVSTTKAPTAPDVPAMIVVPDRICVGGDGRPISAAPPNLTTVDDLVVLVYFRSVDGKRVIVRANATRETCDALISAAAASRKTEGMRLDVMRTCSLDGVGPITIGKSVDGLRIPLPAPSELEHELGPGGALPAIRVVVGPKARAAALLESAATQSCSQMCTRLVEDHVAACIDDIFAVSVASGGPTYSPDPVPCDIQMPTSLSNDFAKMCENEDATKPDCNPGNPVPDLKLWQDSCGGVHVPFDWRAIRPTTQTRQVRGRTGVGRKKSDENPRVRVPGREFLGSTPILDPQGVAPGVSWRIPLVTVWNSSDSLQEFGLQGTVDQDNSIVHIFPRLRTKVVCSGTAGANACMGVEQQTTGGGVVTCACEDRHLPGCTCDPPLVTARYFVCGSGVSRGMPCTRDRHCDPDGQCDGKPHCQIVGAVWTGQADDTGTECTVDEDCAAESNKQCGYRLFNLDNAIENPPPPPAPKTGTIVLEAKIVGGPHKRRGACRTTGAACGNGNGPGACAQGDCRGYQLRAGPAQ